MLLLNQTKVIGCVYEGMQGVWGLTCKMCESFQDNLASVGDEFRLKPRPALPFALRGREGVTVVFVDFILGDKLFEDDFLPIF